MYSASDVDVQMCFLLNQLTAPLAKTKRFPVVECPSVRFPPQSASEYPLDPFLYLSAKLIVPQNSLCCCKMCLCMIWVKLGHNSHCMGHIRTCSHSNVKQTPWYVPESTSSLTPSFLTRLTLVPAGVAVWLCFSCPIS